VDIHIGIQVGSIVSILAAVMYGTYRSSGKYGFGRLLSFWTGFPWTLCVSMVIPAAPRPRRVVEDDSELFAEIRRDRAERLIAERTAPDAVDDEADAPA